MRFVCKMGSKHIQLRFDQIISHSELTQSVNPLVCPSWVTPAKAHPTPHRYNTVFYHILDFTFPKSL